MFFHIFYFSQVNMRADYLLINMLQQLPLHLGKKQKNKIQSCYHDIPDDLVPNYLFKNTSVSTIFTLSQKVKIKINFKNMKRSDFFFLLRELVYICSSLDLESPFLKYSHDSSILHLCNSIKIASLDHSIKKIAGHTPSPHHYLISLPLFSFVVLFYYVVDILFSICLFTCALTITFHSVM